MHTRGKTPSRQSGARNASTNEAITQLTKDHARAKKMFRQYERLAKEEGDGAERSELAAMICAELTAHSTAEEEIFYPAAREAIEESDLSTRPRSSTPVPRI